MQMLNHSIWFKEKKISLPYIGMSWNRKMRISGLGSEKNRWKKADEKITLGSEDRKSETFYFYATQSSTLPNDPNLIFLIGRNFQSQYSQDDRVKIETRVRRGSWTPRTSFLSLKKKSPRSKKHSEGPWLAEQGISMGHIKPQEWREKFFPSFVLQSRSTNSKVLNVDSCFPIVCRKPKSSVLLFGESRIG